MIMSYKCFDCGKQEGVFHTICESCHEQLQTELGRLKKLQGSKGHPEDYCHLCGGRNLRAWYVGNELWNKVVGEEITILCPICFVEIAEKKGITPTAWCLSREGDAPNILHKALRTALMLKEVLEKIEQLQAEIKWLKEVVRIDVAVFDTIKDEYPKVNDLIKKMQLRDKQVDQALNPAGTKG